MMRSSRRRSKDVSTMTKAFKIRPIAGTDEIVLIRIMETYFGSKGIEWETQIPETGKQQSPH
ncbi:unnamed protein product [Rhodiola kirilowii]